MLKIKSADKIAPYTYLLKFLIGDEVKYYYGVRYGNIRLKLKPSTDLFVKYFTSSTSVHNLLKQNCMPFEIIIHKIFENEDQACAYEVKFLKRINAKNRHDFINQVEHFDNSLPKNRGRVHSAEHRQRLSEISKELQSSDEYREAKRQYMKQLWSSSEYKKKMKQHNDLFWRGEKGKKLIEKRKQNPTFRGKKHSSETKQLMSQRAKQIGQDKDFCKRRGKKTLYSCPICNASKLNGGNLNKHMKKYHDWSKESSEIFKKQNIAQSHHQSCPAR